MKLFLILTLVLFSFNAYADKLKCYAFGNGCLQQTTGWHECKQGEINACKVWAKKKPEF